MANIVNKIPAVVDGESAYDFRLKINQAINGINNAFEDINRDYNAIIEVSAQYEQLHADVSRAQGEVAEVSEQSEQLQADIGRAQDEVMELSAQYKQLQADVSRAQDEVETYVETVAKPEINKYFEDFIENGVEDLSTVQLRRNAPIADSTGYLPDFWYKIERGSSPLVLYAKLISPSAIFSDMQLTKNSDWSISNNSWTITGSTKYNSNVAPTTIDKIGIKFMLEDGSRIIIDGATFGGIQAEYDAYSKTIYWNCGKVSSWNEIANSGFTVNNIQVTDGVLTQKFNINITLSAK